VLLCGRLVSESPLIGAQLYGAFAFLRRYVPAVPFPLFFIFCGCVWRALNTKRETGISLDAWCRNTIWIARLLVLFSLDSSARMDCKFWRFMASGQAARKNSGREETLGCRVDVHLRVDSLL
jgi:hypothetical protein